MRLRARSRSSSTARFSQACRACGLYMGAALGILRKALREYLKKHPHVETVAEAPQNEGGGGATLVELRV